MGAGRKTKTYNLNGISESHWSNNGSVTARNLSKSEIGGIIFGCKYNTIDECFSKKLFGLPAPHFSYVRNIDPGLKLFLFNYSDRKLYGVFEAASHGELNIDPHAWSPDGKSNTLFPAQVRIKVPMQYHSLMEDQFRPVIMGNYYAPKLFWFELDQTQKNQLISLISKESHKSLSSPKARQEGSSVEPSALRVVSGSESDWGSTGLDSEWDYCAWNGGIQRVETQPSEDVQQAKGEGYYLKSTSERSYLSVIKGTNEPNSEMKWSSLFKDETTSDASKGLEEIKTPALEVNPIQVEKTESSSHHNTCLDYINDPEEYKSTREYSSEEDVYKPNCKSSYNFSVVGDTIDVHEKFTEEQLQDVSFAEATQVLETESFHSVVRQLLLQVEKLNLSESLQVQKINAMEKELAELREEVGRLKDRSISSEVGSHPETRQVEVFEANKYMSSNSSIADSILMVGGYDGCAWLSTLDSYCPCEDLLRSISSMPFTRSFTSTVSLNDEIYIFGGVHGNTWFDTVESFNLATNRWNTLPSLNQEKGSMAGVLFDKKIYAIGGGDGNECFSGVEMFDLDLGRWITACSMSHKRFAPAAAEMNGIIYVVGGYDGNEYLNLFERYDTREPSWARLDNMSSKRGCHSVAVLNDKLYVLGGFDGSRMVPTVEVFDPRIGRWSAGETMNNSRGYSVAFPLGDAIYIIGGMNSKNDIVQKVEYYKEGGCWELTDLKGVGKRCFFSAAVI